MDDVFDDFEWRDLAACLDHTRAVFFPAGESGAAARQLEQVKSICSGCPVRLECLGYAVETGQRFGVWGGTDEEERKVLRRNWVAAARRGEFLSVDELLESVPHFTHSA